MAIFWSNCASQKSPHKRLSVRSWLLPRLPLRSTEQERLLQHRRRHISNSPTVRKKTQRCTVRRRSTALPKSILRRRPINQHNRTHAQARADYQRSLPSAQKQRTFHRNNPRQRQPSRKIGRNLINYTSLKNPYHVGLINKKELTSFLKKTGFKQIKIQPFHNGFFGAPFIEKVFKQPLIPISMNIHIPFSHHLIAFAYKNQNVQESSFEVYVEVPEMLQCPELH